jgi:biofilm PGA synthesis N-glycosyltransferase PgaC
LKPINRVSSLQPNTDASRCFHFSTGLFQSWQGEWSSWLIQWNHTDWDDITEWLKAVPWESVSHGLSAFVFYYPLFMAYGWIIGSIIYYLFWERPANQDNQAEPILLEYPPVSILIPCYNEAENIRETIEYLLKQKYPDFEIIVINDGSRDNTLQILRQLATEYHQVRVVNLASNQGKATALKAGALLANHEYLICIDGDALLAPEAISWMMRHFLDDPKVGAVTGNPRIRTRSTLLGRIQVGEFSAIIGMIKRAQSVYGRIFTISGVIAAFRRSALHRVGYWSNDMVTEDIDISWKLQLQACTIRFEPNALCWVLMPETLPGLWRQRVRWAQGGAEVLMRYSREMLRWSSRRMWPIYMECLMSIAWAYLMVLVFVILGVSHVFDSRQPLAENLVPNWTAMILSITCLFQFAVSLAIDARYEAKIGGSSRYYYWIIWYPLVYWLINMATTIMGLIRAVRKKRGQRAVWVTLDRGVTTRDRTRH